MYISKHFVKLLIIFLFRIKKNYVVKNTFERIMEIYIQYRENRNNEVQICDNVIFDLLLG